MRKSAILIAGIAIGVYLAKQIESNPEAKKAVDIAGDKVRTFAAAVAEGYREEEAASKPKSSR